MKRLASGTGYLLGGAVILALLALAILSHHRSSSCELIHKPKAGCSPAALEIPAMFQEKDGTSVAACVDAALPACIDYLAPGESVNFGMYRRRSTAPAKGGTTL